MTARRPRWVGLGAMRLASVPEPQARATLRAALDAGVNLVDTADVYGATDTDRHGNERWLGQVVGADVRIVTKGGLVRGPGRWRPDGRAKALRAAAEGSLRALGRERIDLYLLHAPDPRTALATSARALSRLTSDGLVSEVGLCNVGVDQIREVEAIVPVSAVQVGLSAFEGTAIRGGVVEYCLERGIQVLAHSPFGGPKRSGRLARDSALQQIAARRGDDPYAVVLAWLYDLGVVPLPGPSRPEHAAAAGQSAAMTLSEEDRNTLDRWCPLGTWLRIPRTKRRPPPRADGEVVIVMGVPAAGKTTAAAALVDKGYIRFNRDEAGGTMAKLHRQLDAHLADNPSAAVLDNTYPTRALRHEVLEVAWRHGRTVRCIWLDTPLEDAQVNAVLRIWATFGRLPEPTELKEAADPNLFGPEVQTRFRQRLEPPHSEEGFSKIERQAFARRVWPPGVEGTLIAEDVFADVRKGQLGPGPIGVIAWWPGIGAEEAASRRDGLVAELGRPAEVFACTHRPDQRCWCLLPLPGLGVAAIRTLGLDPARSVWFGAGVTHERAARRLQMPFVAV